MLKVRRVLVRERVLGGSGEKLGSIFGAKIVPDPARKGPEIVSEFRSNFRGILLGKLGKLGGEKWGILDPAGRGPEPAFGFQSGP